jgi:hypothetical protein
MSRLLAVALLLGAVPSFAEEFKVDPTTGNSNFTAVFDAKLGERIVAMSSALSCALDYDEKGGTVSGACSVPLTSIQVDNEPTKTEHFQQWATNKKSAAKDCKLEAKLDKLKVGALAPEQAKKFSADVAFTVCGKARADGKKEKVTGTALLFPPGAYGEAKTVRIRANLAKFSREAYQIGPAHTEGWLARVQSLAKVVNDEGVIDFALIATAPKAATPAPAPAAK